MFHLMSNTRSSWKVKRKISPVLYCRRLALGSQTTEIPTLFCLKRYFQARDNTSLWLDFLEVRWLASLKMFSTKVEVFMSSSYFQRSLWRCEFPRCTSRVFWCLIPGVMWKAGGGRKIISTGWQVCAPSWRWDFFHSRLHWPCETFFFQQWLIGHGWIKPPLMEKRS